jgi:CRISPR system Cascade subunit CasD
MSSGDNTLFLRLAGPMQSWGTSSRFQLRRTDAYPSKSGVLGLLLCAKGIQREKSSKELEGLVALPMGVRVDRTGTLGWDYHTAGAKIGMRKAEGGVKHTGNKKDGPIETLLSRRQYLYDASFLVALQEPADAIRACADALNDPTWPVFLGRKCCVPAEPVLAGLGTFDNLCDALSSPSVPWCPRINAIDRHDRSATRTLDTFIEHPPGTPPPADARLVYDVPRVFGQASQGVAPSGKRPARLDASGVQRVLSSRNLKMPNPTTTIIRERRTRWRCFPSGQPQQRRRAFRAFREATFALNWPTARK